MAYSRTNWVARVGTALNRFLKTNETSTEVELTNDPTGVTTAGTPFTVANMNKIEDGIYDNSVAIEDNIDQGVKTTDSPTFASVNTGFGANEVYKFSTQTVSAIVTGSSDVTVQLNAMDVGEIRFVYYSCNGVSGGFAYLKTPAGSNYYVTQTGDISGGSFSGGQNIAKFPEKSTAATGVFIIRRNS